MEQRCTCQAGTATSTTPTLVSRQRNQVRSWKLPCLPAFGEQVGRPREALQAQGGLGDTQGEPVSVPCSTVMSFISLACRGTPPRAQWASWPDALDSRHRKWVWLLLS